MRLFISGFSLCIFYTLNWVQSLSSVVMSAARSDEFCCMQPLLDYDDGNGVSYYIEVDNVPSSATSEEGYGDWSGADFLLSSSL